MANETLLSGDLNGDDTSGGNNNENAYHVLVFDGGDAIGPDVGANVTPATVLSGVTVTAGNAASRSRISLNDIDGGGLYCDGQGNGNACSPALIDVAFIGNTAGDDGGAIYNAGTSGTSSPVIINATFTGNTATNTGGAIYNAGSEGTSSPEITNATFTGNTAGDDGGAIYNAGNSGTSIPQITNAAFTGNTATNGGAIYNNGTAGTSSPEITNTTFTGNSADTGGAIYNLGTFGGTSSPKITNVILWGNSAPDAPEIFNDEAIPTLSHSLVQGLDLTGTGTGNLDGTAPASDPLFIDSGDPDGADAVFGTADDGLRLSFGSPAIDVGDDAAITLTDDLAGAPRIQSGGVDLGAYESTSVTLSGGMYSPSTSPSPGTNDNPVGRLGLIASTPGTSVTGLTLTLSGTNEGAVGIGLWLSESDAFDPATATEVAVQLLTGAEARAASKQTPGTVTFNGLPGVDITPVQQYLFVTVDLEAGAGGDLTIRLADPSDLTLGGSASLASGASAFPLSLSAETPLPVELTTFTAEPTGEAVELIWATAAEQNNSGFEVQRRSEEGRWERLTFVKGAGTTSEPQTYRFRDSALPFADSLVYRLRQVDVDGRAEFSPTVVVGRGSGTAVQLVAPFPNPTRQRATVRYVVPDGGAQPVRLDVYNLLGQRVATLVHETKTSGREEIVLDASGWASGTYFLRLQVGGAMRTERLTVVR